MLISRKKGSAMIMTMVFMMVLVVMCGSFIILIGTQTANVSKTKNYERCYGILMSGVAHSLKELNKIATPPVDSEPNYADDTQNGVIDWTQIGGGRYRVAQRWNDSAGRHVLIVHAQLSGIDRYAMAMAQADVKTDRKQKVGKPFVHALFQGGVNDGNSEYKQPGENRNSFIWGGKKDHADQIHGYPPAPEKCRGYDPNNPTKYANYTDWEGVTPSGGNMYVGDNLHINGTGEVPDGSTVRADGTVTINSSEVDENNLEVISKHTEDKNPHLDNPVNSDFSAEDVIHVRPQDFKARVNYEGKAYLYGGGRGSYVGYGDAFAIQGNQNTYKYKNDPRHIFRMNSTNKPVTGGTDRNDFFLEDMFEHSSGWGYGGETSSGTPQDCNRGNQGGGQDKEPHYDGAGHHVTVSPEGNRKAYLIDGNLWLHNGPAYTFKFMDQSDGTGTQITIAAKGNIYICDNVTYESLQKTAVAFLALKNENDYPDEFGVAEGNETTEGSGNIQFGDPDAGTTYRFCGFMYAENNFRTDNVSNDLHVYGNMTAGGKVMISRGTGDKRKTLIIDYDARIEKGLVKLPELPQDPKEQDEEWTEQNVTGGTYKFHGYTEISKAAAEKLLGESGWNKPVSMQ